MHPAVATGAAGIILANPSTWVLPSTTVEALYGFGGTEAATDAAVRAYLAQRVTVLLGPPTLVPGSWQSALRRWHRAKPPCPRAQRLPPGAAGRGQPRVAVRLDVGGARCRPRCHGDVQLAAGPGGDPAHRSDQQPVVPACLAGFFQGPIGVDSGRSRVRKAHVRFRQPLSPKQMWRMAPAHGIRVPTWVAVRQTPATEPFTKQITTIGLDLGQARVPEGEKRTKLTLLRQEPRRLSCCADEAHWQPA
jgi:hypothetical protein